MTSKTMPNQKHPTRHNDNRDLEDMGVSRHGPTQGAHLLTIRIWTPRGSAETDSSTKKREPKRSPHIAAAGRTRDCQSTRALDQQHPFLLSDAIRTYSLLCQLTKNFLAREGKALHLSWTAYASRETPPIGFSQRMSNTQVSMATYPSRSLMIQHLWFTNA